MNNIYHNAIYGNKYNYENKMNIKKNVPSRGKGRVSTGGPMKYRGCTSQYIYIDDV